MKKLLCQEIRDTWVKFFCEKCERKHKLYPSSSLVPDNPTLLLSSAGMVQFVPIFMGTKPAPEPPRAVTIQKCARVGGKDSDLENIGRTTRHHSFFEMLGNFSFGDYFKAEVIPWAYKFVREELEIPAEKLYISVFAGDEQNAFDKEAYDIWDKLLAKDFPDKALREKHMWKLTRKDNFWGPPGKTGPCGPCSEIYYDLGDHIKEHDDRYVEIWNLVFMEFEKNEEGQYNPLAKKNIDTGAGLERIATISQGVKNSFETNELFAILNQIAKSIGVQYGAKAETDLYLKIITDHLRCLSFLIADGVRPSNAGRGYVLRMITRRAARFAYLLRGKADAFLYEHTQAVVDNYAKAYPELLQQASVIKDTCRKEEEAFAKTISSGLNILEAKLKASGDKVLSGEFVFDLYSTYGFPLELTKEIAEENGFTLDEIGYEAAKEKHSEVSGTGAFASSVESNAYIGEVLAKHGATKFLGYDTLNAKAKVLAVNGNKIILDQTPFYAESGGQMADHGLIGDAKVINTKRIEGIVVHELDDAEGLKTGNEIEAKVDPERRRLTRYHHTSCHLLQAALRKVLGPSVQQMGSQVGPEYTRFDFNLDRGMTKEEIKEVEALVNKWIKAKMPVETKVMDFDAAVKAGALSFFEEKYEDEVRVLFIANDSETASIELCGGTHVSNIGDIEEVVIAQEGSVASGTRRIRMLANQVARDYLKERAEQEKREADERDAAERAKNEAKARQKQLTDLALSKADDFLKQAKDNGTAKTLVLDLQKYFDETLDAEVVKTLAEALLSKIEASGSKGLIFLAAHDGSKVSFVCISSQDLVKEKDSVYNASNAVKTAAQICGGGGGGRPNFAQAGGKDASKIPEALDKISSILN